MCRRVDVIHFRLSVLECTAERVCERECQRESERVQGAEGEGERALSDREGVCV
jgi:hypothetical protein